jgi:hypothetical protein
MKRKIEAKMKAQGVQSHDALAQEIALSIIEKNDESPVISPSVQSPEEVRDAWTSTFNTPNNTPGPPPTLRIATASPETRKGLSSPISCSQDQLDGGPVPISAQSEISSESQQTTPEDVMAVDNRDDVNDEEARLVAELEAERLAEEKARQKRRKLEARLASARGRRVQSSTNISSEREGREYHRNMFSPTQDSTSSLHE